MTCIMCDGEMVELGQLGQFMWYRCRCCGWEDAHDTFA